MFQKSIEHFRILNDDELSLTVVNLVKTCIWSVRLVYPRSNEIVHNSACETDRPLWRIAAHDRHRSLLIDLQMRARLRERHGISVVLVPGPCDHFVVSFNKHADTIATCLDSA